MENVIEMSRKPLGLPGGCKALFLWSKKNIFIEKYVFSALKCGTI